MDTPRFLRRIMAKNKAVEQMKFVRHFSTTLQLVEGMAELPPPALLHRAFMALEAKSYAFQLEAATTTGRLHYQIHLTLNEPNSASNVRACIKSYTREYYKGGCLTVRPSHNPAASEAYCLEDEKRVEGSKPFMWPDNQYRGKDLVQYDNLYPWQKKVHDTVVLSEPDSRKIMCIIDQIGGKGKSMLTKLLGWKHKARVVPLGSSAAQMKSALVKAGAYKIYLIDIPRNNKDWQFIFDTIEELKRGLVVSSFHGQLRDLYMDRPHIVCFTNVIPDLELLSFDMWDLYTVGPDFELRELNKFGIQSIQTKEKEKATKILNLTNFVPKDKL